MTFPGNGALKKSKHTLTLSPPPTLSDQSLPSQKTSLSTPLYSTDLQHEAIAIFNAENSIGIYIYINIKPLLNMTRSRCHMSSSLALPNLEFSKKYQTSTPGTRFYCFENQLVIGNPCERNRAPSSRGRIINGVTKTTCKTYVRAPARVVTAGTDCHWVLSLSPSATAITLQRSSRPCRALAQSGLRWPSQSKQIR